MRKTFHILISLWLALGPVFAQDFIVRRRTPPPVGGDIAFTELTQGCGSSTGNISTASITPTSGRVVWVGSAWAVPSGDPSAASPNITGNGLTWTQIGTQRFDATAGRRRVYVWRGTGTPSAGAVTFTRTGADNIEVCWSIDETSNTDSTTPNDTATTDATDTGAGGTSSTVSDVGTPGTGDCVYGVFGISGAAVSASLEAGYTVLSNQGGGTDVRTIIAGYDCTAPIDETPSASWTGTENYAGVGFIINKAP